MNRKEIPIGILSIKTTLGFVVLVPAYTCLLLVFKGLPTFAASHPLEVLIWVYQSTWLAALVSGALVSAVISLIVRRTLFFHWPFDFGRCFSLGGVFGALTEAFATWVYRGLFHRPYSNFWIAGAMIAGFLAGATLLPLLIWVSLKKEVS